MDNFFIQKYAKNCQSSYTLAIENAEQIRKISKNGFLINFFQGFIDHKWTIKSIALSSCPWQ